MFAGLDIQPKVLFFVGLVIVGVLFLRDGGTSALPPPPRAGNASSSKEAPVDDPPAKANR